METEVIQIKVGWTDWLIIGAYLAAVIGVGCWLGKGQKTARDYFLGSRNIPWWGVSLSIIATETSALTFIGIPAAAYGGNLGFMQMTIGFALARFVLALWFVPAYFRGDIYSPYQLLEESFGENAKRMGGVLFLISGTLGAGVRVFATCIPVQMMLGIDIGWSIVLFVALSLIYTYVGGIKAVVWTDAIQFLLLAGGGLLVVCLIPGMLDGGFSGAWQAAGGEGKTTWLNLDFTLAAPYNLWMGVIGGTVLGLSTHGADQLNVQRVLACKSIADGRKALCLSAVIIPFLFLLFLVLGVLLWAFYQEHGLQVPGTVPMNADGEPRTADYVFPIFILTELPAAVRALLIVAVLSAAMSSVSSALSALSSVSVMDFVRPWKARSGTELSDDNLFRLSKVATLGWAAGLILVGVLAQHVESVFSAALGLQSLSTGAMLGGLALALFVPVMWSQAVITGMGASLVVMAVLHFGFPKLVDWPWYTLIGGLVCVGVAGGLHAGTNNRSGRGRN